MTEAQIDAALDAAFAAVRPMFDPDAPLSPIDATRVADLLQHGFGVEDIALMIRRPADTVRRVVRQFRRRGDLRRWFG